GVAGTTINGARLWLDVGGQLVQTTELIKVLLVVFVAGYLADEAAVLSIPPVRFRARRYSMAPRLIPLLVALGASIGALALLRDLGSIAILLLFAGGMLFIATGRLRYPAAAAVVALVAASLGYVAFDHAEARIDTWLDPWSDADGDGYQSIQAIYAIEAGGITGTGLGLGRPDAIPAAPTDYVFSAIAEELGLAAAAGVALIYVLFLYGGLRVAIDCPDRFGRLLAASVAVLIAIQAAVIIAGNLRIVPTTGITLPFVSYGGSSLVVNFFLAGILTGISQASFSRR
ncbi:MAG: FtsW/RodA/SpoVE family cell cycle protein, partial [Dehalococcoidia bacterium]